MMEKDQDTEEVCEVDGKCIKKNGKDEKKNGKAEAASSSTLEKAYLEEFEAELKYEVKKNKQCGIICAMCENCICDDCQSRYGEEKERCQEHERYKQLIAADDDYA